MTPKTMTQQEYQRWFAQAQTSGLFSRRPEYEFALLNGWIRVIGIDDDDNENDDDDEPEE